MGHHPNQHMIDRIVSATKRGDPDDGLGTSELDSHANMICVGKQATIVQHTGKFTDVNAFAEDVGKLQQVPIVDAAIAYDCPYDDRAYILVMSNVLHVESMDHNLIPPFIMREAGLRINEQPKMQTKSPSIEHH